MEFARRIGASGCHSVFGLMRTQALRNTRLIGSFVCSDIVLLGELATQGPLWEIPDRLFCSRIHPGCSHQKFRSKENGFEGYAEWFDPANSGKPIRLLRTKLVMEQLRGIRRSALSPWTKLACGCAFATAWSCREGRVALGAFKRDVRRRLRGAANVPAPSGPLASTSVSKSPPASNGSQPPEQYDRRFFISLANGSRRSAEVIVPLVLARYPARNVVDVGCGTGGWLSVFAQHGVADIQGIDGDYVDRLQLEIPSERFAAADLSRPVKFNRKFDLAVCLEVGEHLPAIDAPTLVESLSRLSEVVLFSAAIPGQRGTHHVNEQWPEYWARLFERHGYQAIDCIRPLIWNHDEVNWWYAQNTILYASAAAIASHPRLAEGSLLAAEPPMRLVHPGHFAAVRGELDALQDHTSTPSLRWSARTMTLSFRKAVHRRLPWKSNGHSQE